MIKEKEINPKDFDFSVNVGGCAFVCNVEDFNTETKAKYDQIDKEIDSIIEKQLRVVLTKKKGWKQEFYKLYEQEESKKKELGELIAGFMYDKTLGVYFPRNTKKA